jgi:hypothetical protein
VIHGGLGSFLSDMGDDMRVFRASDDGNQGIMSVIVRNSSQEEIAPVTATGLLTLA